MVSGIQSDKLISSIDGFICSRVTGRGLDVRTEKAYRLDLEHLCEWMKKNGLGEEGEGKAEEEKIEKLQDYFLYLSQEKQLRPSTISRKYRVIGYYLRYLAEQGMSGEDVQGQKQDKDDEQRLIWKCRQESARELVQDKVWMKKDTKNPEMVQEDNSLSKREVDTFFQAIRKEYEDLDSDFRRRVCLRDQIMMELLFYHGLEISELLKMEISDYDPKSGVLAVPKKRNKVHMVGLFSKELQEQMGRWMQEHEYFEQDNGFQGKMFLSKLGKPLSMKMVINIFEKYRVLAGIEKECTPKDLKRSMKGYAWEVVKEVYGQGE